MRSIRVWAYHADFGTLCRDARLDESTGIRYPVGTKRGQAGWDVAIQFRTLSELAEVLKKGVPMPAAFCGNWFQDCDPIKRGEITRLAIMAHGDHGKFAVNGRYVEPKLDFSNIGGFHSDLHTIGLFTPERDATILVVGCLAGSGPQGSKLLIALSRVWPGRTVVGFSTLGYRHPGEMKRRGAPCEFPGMRDTDATDYLFADPPRWDKVWSDFAKMPWASDTSPHAKIVRDGAILRYPINEAAATVGTPQKALTGPPRETPRPRGRH